MSDGLLDTRAAAARLGVKPQTLEAWRVQGRTAPAWVKIGRCVRYVPADLEAFVLANRRGNVSGGSA